MATMSLKRQDAPFLLGGASEIALDVSRLKLTDPIPEDLQGPVASVAFKGAGETPFALGQDDTVKVGLSASADVQVVSIFAGAKGRALELLRANGLGDYFDDPANAAHVVLAFDAGASVAGSVAGSFAYSFLKPSFKVTAGADGGYAYLRAMDKSRPVREILPAFFRSMRLPEQMTPPPGPGEAIALHYGGYLRLGAEVSAGYELTGTKSIALGQLALSEKYALSVVGQIGLAASLAGQFAIVVSGVTADPGWVRVQVRRRRARDLKVAADVNVVFDQRLDHLPTSADEFLGAVLGVNAKSFLQVLRRAHELSDFDAFRKAVDGLAQRYVGELIGKGFDALQARTEFGAFMKRVNRIVTSYEQLEDRAVTLFDRYFDELGRLTSFLDEIAALTPETLATLRKRLDPERWKMLAQLTDGDPLGFLEARAQKALAARLAELKRRASAALELARGEAHAEIREAIGLAKRRFGVDVLFRELSKVDTVDELQALASDKVGLFVTRLVGRSLDSAANLKAALKEVKAVLDKLDGFAAKLYDAFRAAANASYSMALHAEYSRASEADALVDVLINGGDPRGAALLAEAGRGELERVLTMGDTDVVRLLEGVLTHRTRRHSAFKVHIVGWHLDYRYEGFDRVITETEQRLIPSESGITVLTTASVEIARARKRRLEEVQASLLLRALGESAGVIAAGEGDRGYVIEALSSLAARYELSFTDEDTSEVELRDYLAFARDVGLDTEGATLEGLAPLLPRAANGGFGAVSAAYEVRFGRESLEALLKVKKVTPKAEEAIRAGMRRMVLANYLKDEGLHDVAFAYATPAVFTRFQAEGPASFTNRTVREFPVAVPLDGLAAPGRVVLNQVELNTLATLYNIENAMVSSIRELYAVLTSTKPLTPAAFERKLGRFGDAMGAFDRFDQGHNTESVGTTTLFEMFRLRARQASPAAPVSAAVLRLKSEAKGTTVEKLFLSEGAFASLA
jgi:hypothetical protein